MIFTITDSMFSFIDFIQNNRTPSSIGLDLYLLLHNTQLNKIMAKILNVFPVHYNAKDLPNLGKNYF